MKLLFATNNQNKLREIKSVLPTGLSLLSLADVGFEGEIPETTGTIEGNALQKAQYLFQKLGLITFADDTGLEIEALNGRPGVDSAFYSGSRDSAANIKKVLTELRNKTNRSARFKTVISLCSKSDNFSFTGIVNGFITNEPRGNLGFGYDPIFCPQGETKTFGEMSLAEKNKNSHRVKALEQLIDFLRQLKQN